LSGIGCGSRKRARFCPLTFETSEALPLICLRKQKQFLYSGVNAFHTRKNFKNLTHVFEIINLGPHQNNVETKPLPPRGSFQTVSFYLKRANWRRYGSLKNYYSVVLQLCEISDLERFSAMTKVFFQHSHGAVVFWRPRHPASLAEAVKWRTKIAQEVCSPIPCVLVTENVVDSCANSVKWIGHGGIFESELALDQFCKDNGFVGHFEITSRDWESGERSVFGQAVNCLLDEILQGDEKEDKTML